MKQIKGLLLDGTKEVKDVTINDDLDTIRRLLKTDDVSELEVTINDKDFVILIDEFSHLHAEYEPLHVTLVTDSDDIVLGRVFVIRRDDDCVYKSLTDEDIKTVKDELESYNADDELMECAMIYEENYVLKI